MAHKYREDLVGKRFLSVSGASKINVGKVSEWGWKAGVIRASSHKDNKDKELQVLVEYDGVDWQRREWLAVYSKKSFRVFLVEKTLVWAPKEKYFLPALTFVALVNEASLSSEALPVEFLHDRSLGFPETSSLQPYQDWDDKLAAGAGDTASEAKLAAAAWRSQQDGQRILTTTPSVLGGCRAQVYRVAGTTQWYTAVIVGVNDATGELTVTDDTVLEEHSEDPALVQMRLLGDGVVESIMRGEVVGVMPRRSRSNLQNREGAKSQVSTGNRKKGAVKNGQLAPGIDPTPSQPSATQATADTDTGADKEVKKNKVNECKSADKKCRGVCVSGSGCSCVSGAGASAGAVVQQREADEERSLASGGGAVGSAVASEEDDCVIVCARDAEERSDSGVSSARSAGSAGSGGSASGDERSGSRGSAAGLACPQPAPQPQDDWRAMAQAHAHGYGAAPPPPPPALIHLPPPPPAAAAIYQDLLWKPRYPMHHADYLAHTYDRERHTERLLSHSVTATRSTGSAVNGSYSAPTGHVRSLRYTRDKREQEQRELIEKQQKEKERERIEREREKLEREREREKQEREERERREENNSATLVHKHFVESLRLASQKRELGAGAGGAGGWGSLPLHPAHPAHRYYAHHAPPSAQPPVSHPQQVVRAASGPGKTADYPPPAHGRLNPIPQKPPDKPAPNHAALPKGEPNFSSHYNYVAYRGTYDKLKESQHLPAPPPLVQEPKNSVIVKHDAKQIHLDQKNLYSNKVRVSESGHYLSGRGYPATSVSPHGAHPPPQAPLAPAAPRARPSYPPPPKHSPHYYYSGGGGGGAAAPQPQSAPRGKVSSPAPPHMYGKPHASPPVHAHAEQALLTPKDPPQVPLPYPLPNSYTPAARARPLPPHLPHPRTPPPRPAPGPPRAHQPSPPNPLGISTPCQTQPLDLGISSREDPDKSPRRRFPYEPAADAVDPKRRRLDSSSPASVSPRPSSEPTPLIASAAACTGARGGHGSEPAPQAPGPPCDVRVPSADGSVQTPEKAAGASPAHAPATPSPSPAPSLAPASSPSAPTPPPQPAPAPTPPATTTTAVPEPDTPGKVSSPAPAAPSPRDSGAQPTVRHLGKKAWLQRHETAPIGEGDCSGGGGSCLTLPMTVVSRPPHDPNDDQPNSVAMPVATKSLQRSTVNNIVRKTPKARKSAKDINGRLEDPRDAEDSSSSERESYTTTAKRKPPKTKRRKGNSPRKSSDESKKKKASESGSDSDKESDDKDSDSGGSGSTSSRARGAVRARGRRRGGGRGAGGAGRRRDEGGARRGSGGGSGGGAGGGARARRAGESFLQDGACCEVAPRLGKCRECRWSPALRDKDMPNIFCRFYAFRRLKYTKAGQLAIAGFSHPYKDADEDDKKLWLNSSGAADLDIEMSCFLLREIGDQFCELLKQEKEAEFEDSAPAVAWKRVVQGVREMCDVCETTLFNYHWTCGKCGFVVCLDCYKSRTTGESGASEQSGGSESGGGGERDPHGWLLCTGNNNNASGVSGGGNGGAGAAHAPRKLLLTQIAAGGALREAAERCHRARALYGLPACACGATPVVAAHLRRAATQLLHDKLKANVKKEEVKEENPSTNGSSPVKTENGKSAAPLSWLTDVPLDKNKSPKSEKSDSSSSDSEDGNYSTLRELLIRPAPNDEEQPKKKKKKSDIIEDMISSIAEVKEEDGAEVKRYGRSATKCELPPRLMTLTESRLLYPNVPHAWLCDGKLLHLTEPHHPMNYKPFQDQWQRGQPVLVSDLSLHLAKDLWSPESFSKDFGETRVDLVNCASGLVVPKQPARKFWDGFELASRRLRDDRGAPMVLKLKDWPPGEDFAELLPSRFDDLMRALPLSEYTARNGKLNLAARLPECFVRPDLGPKMYTAYGGAGGTTNLHLDVSDAVNVMVHASAPTDAPERAREAAKAADEAGVDVVSRRRARQRPAGALWHIYAARDADKIRDFLVRMEIERGARPRPNHDPVHDQTWYLDAALRERLYREYGVEGYAVLQCAGDCVFVPAGAPHQVRNLLDCIKVAEDFVSPENVSRCFELGQQFRRLSRNHSNKEDKLQIKNIVYHAVKDSVCCLEAALPSNS